MARRVATGEIDPSVTLVKMSSDEARQLANLSFRQRTHRQSRPADCSLREKQQCAEAQPLDEISEPPRET